MDEYPDDVNDSNSLVDYGGLNGKDGDDSDDYHSDTEFVDDVDANLNVVYHDYYVSNVESVDDVDDDDDYISHAEFVDDDDYNSHAEFVDDIDDDWTYADG